MKKAIVTGATSFIGIALLKELLSADYQVFAIIRPNSDRKKTVNEECPEAYIVECDISNLRNLTTIIADLDGCDEFYHIAWNSDFDNPRYNLEKQMKNVDYMLKAMETAKMCGCNSFISVGSQAECGLVTKPINSHTPDAPITAYAKAKREAYIKGCELSEKLGIDFYWPRLLSAYGPYDRPGTLVMSCIDACINCKDIKMTKAEQIWDYVYVNDVARALRLIAQKGSPQKKYSIASGKGRLLADYIKDISDVFEYPELLNGLGKREYSENEVMYLVGDVSELYDDTGMIFNSDFKGYLADMREMLVKE